MNIMNQKLAVFRNDVVNDLSACRICFEPFTTPRGNRAPRLLPQCGHTFCSKCVITLFGPRDFRGFSTVTCPTCQAERDMFKELEVLGFVLNRHVLDLLEAFEKSRPSAEEIASDAEIRNCVAVFRNDVGNDLLACRICSEPFTTPNGNRAPRLLPQCGHTFCSKCVITLFGPQDFRGFSRVTCPTCQAEYDMFLILEIGAGGFVLNHHVLDLLEAFEKSRPSAEEISAALGCSIEDAGEA